MSDDAQNEPKPDDADGGQAASKATGSLTLLMVAGIGVAIVTLAVLIFYLLFMRDTRPYVWAEPTQPYNAERCAVEGACEEINLAGTGHGSHGEEGASLFVYDPTIDDEIAQWGDCLDQVLVCVQDGMAEEDASPDGPDVVRNCVAAADLCPGECRERFANRAANLELEAIEQLFFATFVDERGYCVPREADR